MSSCGSCRSGRCGDFSSKAVGLPSLAAIDVVERILLQAVKNTAQRSVDASQGKLTRQDLVEADEACVVAYRYLCRPQPPF